MYRGEFKRELKNRIVKCYSLFPDDKVDLEVVNATEWTSRKVQDLLCDYSFTMGDRDSAVRARVLAFGLSIY